MFWIITLSFEEREEEEEAPSSIKLAWPVSLTDQVGCLLPRAPWMGLPISAR
jgi:hypothetical protein